MPELTPNFELKKPLGNERVTRASYNENLDIIDQNVKDSIITVQNNLTTHLAGFPNHGNLKNKIINGNFDIWQRGASFTGNVYSADRWIAQVNNPYDSTITRQSFTLGQTEVPNNPRYYLRFSPSANQAGGNNIRQRIEGVRTLAGKTVTLSMWLRASQNLNSGIYIRQNFGTGGSPSASVDKFKSINVTTQWQKFAFTTALESISSKVLGSNNNDNLEIIITTQLGNTAHNLDIAQVQLEEGEIATLFEQRPIGLELMLCQRYYEKSYSDNYYPGTALNNQGIEDFTGATGEHITGKARFAINKRTNSPTITIYDMQGNAGKITTNGATSNITPVVIDNLSNSGFKVYHKETGVYRISYHWAADAEL